LPTLIRRRTEGVRGPDGREFDAFPCLSQMLSLTNVLDAKEYGKRNMEEMRTTKKRRQRHLGMGPG
jgi:hypothetical protein